MGIADKSPCNAYSLSLPTRQQDAFDSNFRIVSLWQRDNEVVNSGVPTNLMQHAAERWHKIGARMGDSRRRERVRPGDTRRIINRIPFLHLLSAVQENRIGERESRGAQLIMISKLDYEDYAPLEPL